jgi:hypothetical protein
MLEPPNAYIVAAGLLVAVVAWTQRAALQRVYAFANSHRLLLGIGLVVVLAVAAAIVEPSRRLFARWRGRERAPNLVADWPELAEGLQLAASSVLGLQ